MSEMVCHWCKQPLQFKQGVGWVHPEGGLYMVACDDCGWHGAPATPPFVCPVCGGTRIRDKHAALPEPKED